VASLEGSVADAVTVPVTLFAAPHRWAISGTRRSLAWAQLRTVAERPDLWPGEPTIDASEARLRGVTFAWMRDDTRVLAAVAAAGERETEQRVEQIGGLAVEYVDEPLADEAHLRRWWEGVLFLAYTSTYHQQPWGDRPPGPRWRVLLPLSRPVTLADAQRIGRWIQHPRRNAGSIDDATLRPARVVPLPAIVPGGYAWFEGEGAPLDPERALRDLERWAEADRRDAAARAVEGSTLAEAVQGFRGRLEHAWLRAFLPWPGDILAIPQDGPHTELRGLLGGVEVELGGLGRLAGSLWPGRLALLVGASGSGRTSLALQLAEAAAADGHPVLFATADLPTDEVVARLMILRAARGGPMVPPCHAGILQGQGERGALADAAEALVGALPNLYVWAPITSERTDAALMARAAGTEGRPPLVIVDPIEGFDDGDDLEGAYRELSAACRDLTRPGTAGSDWPGAAVLAVVGMPAALGDDLSTASVLAAACAQPAGRSRLREVLALELGGLAGDASLVLVLARDAVGSDGRGDAVVVVAKNRHGHTGVAPLTFFGSAGVFSGRQ
jgi:hypothetical protein